MKKKTRTNWLGGLLSICVLLLSFFLMSYQTRQDNVGKSDVKQVQTDTLKVIKIPYQLPTIADGDSSMAATFTLGLHRSLVGNDSISIGTFSVFNDPLSQSDTLTLQQATMDLINRETSGIAMFTDGDGNIISIQKKGKKLAGKTLETYKKAYERLVNFVKQEQNMAETLRLMELEFSELKQQQERVKESKELVKTYQSQSVQLRTQALLREHSLMLEELRQRLLRLSKDTGHKTEKLEKIEELYHKMILEQTRMIFEMDKAKKSMESADSEISKETEQQWSEYLRALERRLYEISKYRDELAAQETPQSISRDLRELLRYNPSYIRDLKSGEFDGHEDDDVIRVKAKDRNNIIKTYEVTVGEIRQLQIANGNYTFTEHESAQERLVKEISEVSGRANNPLIVVDGEVHKDWTYIDLNKLNENLIIKSLTVQSADKVTDPAYTSLMSDRNALILIETASGGKNFKRPKFYEGQGRIISSEELAMRKEELFTKKMLESMEMDGLLKNGWSSLELSNRELTINGKTQPKKTLKKYLRLYKDTTGKSLSKNKSIKLSE